MENLGITITFNVDSYDWDQKVDGLNKDLRLLKKEVSQFNKYLKFDPGNIEVLTNKIKNLEFQEKLAKKILEEYREELETLRKKGETSGDHWNGTINAIDKATNDLINVQKQLQKANAELEEMTNLWNKAANAAAKVSQTTGELAEATKGVSNTAKGFLKDAIQESIDFEDAFADVEKTVNATDEEFTDIKAGLRDLAKEVPTSASELAKVAGLAGQMNVQAEDIVKFTKSMVDFGNATNITAEEAAQEIAQIYNVIGKGNDFSDLDALLSTIVELGNNTATTEKDIVTMFRNIAAASSRVGMTEPQIAALAATLSSLGLDKGGASAISRIMTNIDMAVDKNSETLKDWANVAGVSADKFKEIWNTDATSGLMMVVEGIANADEKGTSLNKTLEDLGVSELRQVDTLSRLVNAHQNYSDNIDMANEAYDKGIALEDEATKRYRTVASQVKTLMNNFKEFALTIGDIFLPVVENVINFIKQITEWLNNLDPEVKQMIAYGIAFIAVLSPMLTAISKISGLAAGLIPYLPKIANAIKIIITVVKSLWGLISGLFETLITFAAAHPLVAAIMAVAAAFVFLYQKCEPFRDMVDKLIAKIKELWTKFKETNWIEKLGEKFGWLGEKVGWLIEKVKDVFNWFGNLIEKAKEFLGLSGEVSSAASNVSGTMYRRSSALRSDGFGSGGFNSGGALTLNPVFNVSTNNVTRADVKAWSQWMLDDINDGLGRAI